MPLRKPTRKSDNLFYKNIKELQTILRHNVEIDETPKSFAVSGIRNAVKNVQFLWYFCYHFDTQVRAVVATSSTWNDDSAKTERTLATWYVVIGLYSP